MSAATGFLEQLLAAGTYQPKALIVTRAAQFESEARRLAGGGSENERRSSVSH